MGVCIMLFSLNDIACNGAAGKRHEYLATGNPVMQEAFLAAIEDSSKEDPCTVAERLSAVKSRAWLNRDIEKSRVLQQRLTETETRANS